MDEGFWFSASLGLGAGGIYVLLIFLGLHVAIRQTKRSFVTIILGGMAIRLFLAVGAIAIIIALVAVDETVFLATFLGIFVIGLIIEVTVLHRRRETTQSRDTIQHQA